MTERQKKFCELYADTGDPLESAVAAGYNTKNKTLLKQTAKKNVERFSGEIEKIRLEKLSTSIAGKDEILQFLTKIMRRDSKDTNLVMRTLEEAYFEPDDKGTMRKKSRKERTPEIIETPAKLSEASKAAELIGKHHNMWKESVNEVFSDSIEVNILDSGDDSD